VSGHERAPGVRAGVTTRVPTGASLPSTSEEAASAELALATGDLEIIGLLPRASNDTYLARLCSEDVETLAVYKPAAGEAPLWDFAEGTLSSREVAAYIVAKALGWPGVPPTVLRDGPAGTGSVQLFIDMDSRGEHYFTLRESRADDFRRIALFDAAVNNADRKSGHCLLDREGKIFVIDHGVCFGEEPKLRTVIWDFVGERIPAGLSADLRRLAASLAGGELRARLIGLLKNQEIDAVRDRAETLVSGGAFPRPGPGRHYPWPVV
jgi:Phosphatidylinositol 3- and 4-kinase